MFLGFFHILVNATYKEHLEGISFKFGSNVSQEFFWCVEANRSNLEFLVFPKMAATSGHTSTLNPSTLNPHFP